MCSFIVRICIFGSVCDLWGLSVCDLWRYWFKFGESLNYRGRRGCVEKTRLPSPCPLRGQRRNEKSVVMVVVVVCFFNLMGKDYSMGGGPPIGSLWRISWLAFKTWSSTWAAQHAKVGNRSGSVALVCWRNGPATQTWVLDASSLQPRNGFEGCCLFPG